MTISYRNRRRFWLVFGAVVVSAVIVVAARPWTWSGASTEPAPEDYAWAATHGPIRIAAGPGLPPAYIADEHGQLTGGHLIELVSLAASRAAVNVEYVTYPDVGAAVAAVVTGEADMVVAADRPDVAAAGLEATAPFGEASLSLLAVDPEIVTSDDLAGRRVATAPGSPLVATLQQEFPEVEYVETRTVPEGFVLLLSGQIDGYFGTLDMVSYFLQQGFPTAHIVGEPAGSVSISLHAPSGSPQIRLLQHGRSHITDAEIRAAHVRWAGADLRLMQPTRANTSNTLLVASMVAIAVLSSALLVRRQYRHRRELAVLRSRDELTGLLNRTGLSDAIASAAKVAPTRCFAVCYVDLDGFKEVNDSLGHAAGDQVLISTANRLTADLRTTDVVARVGGDEFVAVISDLPEDSSYTVIERISSRWIDSLAEPVPTVAGIAEVSASVGVAIGHQGDDPAELLSRADQAMYRAKRAGRHRVAVHGEPELAPELMPDKSAS